MPIKSQQTILLIFEIYRFFLSFISMLLYFVYVFQQNFFCSSFKIKTKSFLSTLWFRPVHQYPFRSIHKKTIQFLFIFSQKHCSSFSVVSESVEFSFITIILSAYLCIFTKNIFSALKAFQSQFPPSQF